MQLLMKKIIDKGLVSYIGVGIKDKYMKNAPKMHIIHVDWGTLFNTHIPHR